MKSFLDNKAFYHFDETLKSNLSRASHWDNLLTLNVFSCHIKPIRVTDWNREPLNVGKQDSMTWERKKSGSRKSIHPLKDKLGESSSELESNICGVKKERRNWKCYTNSFYLKVNQYFDDSIIRIETWFFCLRFTNDEHHWRTFPPTNWLEMSLGS